ncbi:hypothetical protein AVEN_253859-1 [Araneus ventricosus]|uniref:Uncharacterized protein n=1 Tax=Araneus ventricosus TaxID=182803 RepID=A0A4Y2NAT2_ARAVE|nr:hypothetical protein AVEN_253859-1 [Araneus ventricosus]
MDWTFTTNPRRANPSTSNHASALTLPFFCEPRIPRLRIYSPVFKAKQSKWINGTRWILNLSLHGKPILTGSLIDDRFWHGTVVIDRLKYGQSP